MNMDMDSEVFWGIVAIFLINIISIILIVAYVEPIAPFDYFNGEVNITKKVSSESSKGYEFDNNIEIVIKNRKAKSIKKVEFDIICVDKSYPIIDYKIVKRQVGCEDIVIAEKKQVVADTQHSEIINVDMPTCFKKVKGKRESVDGYTGAYLVLIINSERTDILVSHIKIKQ